MIKFIKLRFYNAMCNRHMKQAIVGNKLANQYLHEAIEHAEKANNYLDKINIIAPELEEVS